MWGRYKKIWWLGDVRRPGSLLKAWGESQERWGSNQLFRVCWHRHGDGQRQGNCSSSRGFNKGIINTDYNIYINIYINPCADKEKSRLKYLKQEVSLIVEFRTKQKSPAESCEETDCGHSFWFLLTGTKSSPLPASDTKKERKPRGFGEKWHLPLAARRPGEDKAAGKKLRDESGTKALRSSEQSGLPGSFSILAHYFPTSSASFETREPDLNSRTIFFFTPSFPRWSSSIRRRRRRRRSWSSESPEGPETVNDWVGAMVRSSAPRKVPFLSILHCYMIISGAFLRSLAVIID